MEFVVGYGIVVTQLEYDDWESLLEYDHDDVDVYILPHDKFPDYSLFIGYVLSKSTGDNIGNFIEPIEYFLNKDESRVSKLIHSEVWNILKTTKLDKRTKELLVNTPLTIAHFFTDCECCS